MRRRLVRTLVLLVAPLLVTAVPARASVPPVLRGVKHTFGDTPCRLIPMQTDAGVIGPPGYCKGVRPGAALLVKGGLCTMNFVFKGRDRYTYVGTAGHCYKESNYEKRWSGYTGPTAFDSYGAYIGNFAYGILNNSKDFALIRLRPGQRWSAKMCYFGGPDGIYEKHDPGPQILHQYGNGVYWGQHYPARTYVTPTLIETDQFVLLGQGGPGDSGSGIIDRNGEAVGVLVAGVDVRVLGFNEKSWPSQLPWVAAAMIGTRLDVQVKRAQQVMNTHLAIQNAAVAPLSLT